MWGICGRLKSGTLKSYALALGDGWFESARLRIPFLTAARISARSLSPPMMLLRERVSLDRVPLSDDNLASTELRSSLGYPVPPPGWSWGLTLTFTFSRSASTVTIETCAMLASLTGPSAAGTPTTDLGRNRPTSDRVPFFMPWPILRSITEAEEAVEEIDKLSVEPVKKFPWPE